ncbi:MAG: beta-lactamase hydrolase domain-containing protein [Pseudohongiellaceae bacterium]
MKIMKASQQVTLSSQISAQDLESLADDGVELVICNRPDDEAADQVSFNIIQEAASALGMEAILIAFKTGEMNHQHIESFTRLLTAGKKTHAYCRTGNRSFCLFAAFHASQGRPEAEITALSKEFGFDIAEYISPYYVRNDPMTNSDAGQSVSENDQSYDVVIVGAGAGGISVASSLRKRNSRLRIALIDPATEHYYQPGWTMVGGGIFSAESTKRRTASLIPENVSWVQQSVVSFAPENNEVELANGGRIKYSQLIVCPGLKLNWKGVKGLEDTLGKNGVTSNYRFDLAPYTWKLVQGLRSGKALFTQPPMPIKCAGAPQKALYLSCDHWLNSGALNHIDVEFFNAGGVLFGVADYVPALQSYIEKYKADVHYMHNLQEIDGENKVAYFKKAGDDGEELVSREFDMIHVCPPQCAPDFISDSELSDDAGWLDVNPSTLQHRKFANVWGLGDVMNTTNAKTMAAARKQVPVVAENLIDTMEGRDMRAAYDGYGSCPLTVERGKIVLAEFGYGGKVIPTFPTWLLNGKQPTRRAWTLKADILPSIYWQAMLKGREWLAAPKPLAEVEAE